MDGAADVPAPAVLAAVSTPSFIGGSRVESRVLIVAFRWRCWRGPGPGRRRVRAGLYLSSPAMAEIARFAGSSREDIQHHGAEQQRDVGDAVGEHLHRR